MAPQWRLSPLPSIRLERMTRLARTFGWGDKFADDSGTTPEELCSEAVAVEPEPEPPLPEQPVRGLKNLGNSCYLNAVLQSLLAAEPFRLYLVGDAVTGEGPTTTALRNWARHMHNGNTAAVAPTKVLQAVRRAHRRFAGRSQQDAQEVGMRPTCRSPQACVALLWAGATGRHPQRFPHAQRSPYPVSRPVLPRLLAPYSHQSPASAVRTSVSQPLARVGSGQPQRVPSCNGSPSPSPPQSRRPPSSLPTSTNARPPTHRSSAIYSS